MNKVNHLWSTLRASFWFVPSLIVAFSTVLAVGLIEADSGGNRDWMDDWPRLFGASAAGARGMLATIAGAMTTVVGVTFSMTLVAEETLAAVDRLFPEKMGRNPTDDDDDSSLPLWPARTWQAVVAKRNGYLQSVDDAALLSLAREHKTIVRMERGIGEFVVQNTPLASLSLELPPNEEIIAALRAAYSIDRYRTVKQDCAFGIRQLVDMALRALSPSINDTTTAVMCVDYLTAILVRLASREIPSSGRYEDGKLRVICIGPTYSSLVAESFDEIRVSAKGNLAIMLRMLGALQTLDRLTDCLSRRRVLWEQVEFLAELAGRTIESPHDRARFQSRLARVRETHETKTAVQQ